MFCPSKVKLCNMERFTSSIPNTSERRTFTKLPVWEKRILPQLNQRKCVTLMHSLMCSYDNKTNKVPTWCAMLTVLSTSSKLCDQSKISVTAMTRVIAVSEVCTCDFMIMLSNEKRVIFRHNQYCSLKAA